MGSSRPARRPDWGGTYLDVGAMVGRSLRFSGVPLTNLPESAPRSAIWRRSSEPSLPGSTADFTSGRTEGKGRGTGLRFLSGQGWEWVFAGTQIGPIWQVRRYMCPQGCDGGHSRRSKGPDPAVPYDFLARCRSKRKLADTNVVTWQIAGHASKPAPLRFALDDFTCISS
jgi:hypothetical protein